MPELPEVESIKKIVSPIFIGQNLIKYSINDERTNRFNSKIPNNLGVLLDISRIGKVLDFTFKDYSILFHLGMSGRIEINCNINKHTRGEFQFNKDYLLFDDIRKFGYIKITSNDLKDIHFKIIGPDILELSIKNKRNILKKAKKSKVTIKNFLLNQKNMSGLGNIYVNEILFKAKINPLSTTEKLNQNHWNDIFLYSKKVLISAIKNNGTTLDDMTYFLPNGNYGSNQNFLNVYNKNNCNKCKNKIDKLYIDNRSSYVCKKCQFLVN
jgi:formamidopyrimidine-DNA glycosylase